MGKTGRNNRKYSAEFKLSVIMDMMQNHLGYRETVRKYLPNLDPSNVHTIQRWERIYLEEGAEGLKIERKGRATNMDGKKKGRPRKNPAPEVQEDLIAENQRLKERLEYLEAENEYLKKLRALIQEEEARKAERKKK